MLRETRGRGSSAEATPPEKRRIKVVVVASKELKVVVVASKEKMLEVVKLLDFWGVIGQPRAMLMNLLKTDSGEGG